MNIALLCKIRAITASVDQLINQTKVILAKEPPEYQIEMAFYLAEGSADQYYIFSYFNQEEEVQEAHRHAHASIFNSLKGQGWLLEQRTFTMLREYRRLPAKPKASHIRLITFGDDFSDDQLNQYLSERRIARRNTPDMIGAWSGQDIVDKNTLIHRADWVSLETMQAFFNRSDIQQMFERHRTMSKKFEFASFNLQSVLELNSTQPKL